MTGELANLHSLEAVRGVVLEENTTINDAFINAAFLIPLSGDILNISSRLLEDSNVPLAFAAEIIELSGALREERIISGGEEDLDSTMFVSSGFNRAVVSHFWSKSMSRPKLYH